MAPLKCCVGGCGATSATHSLFCLPKKDDLRNLWLSFLVPTNPILLGLSKDQLINRRVCEKHFDRHQFDWHGRRLQYAYPCLFTEEEIACGEPLPTSGNAAPEHNYSKNLEDEEHFDETMLVVETGAVPEHNYSKKLEDEDHIDETMIVVGTGGEDNLILHSFPNPEKYQERFDKWLKAVGGPILNLDKKYIFKYKRVCHLHFEEEFWTISKRLCANSLPTLHLCGSNKNQESSMEVTPTTSKGPLHRFPDPSTERFLQWKQVLHRSVQEKGASYICNNVHLCSRHFNEFYCSTQSKRITRNAVPTTNLVPYESQEGRTMSTDIVEPSTSYSHQITEDQDVLEDDIADAIEINLENNEPQHDDVEFVDELRLKKDPETLKHSDFKCNVCRGEIVGFRYVCVQCVDWDMCASCEARGEHPEHYVLRLPAPKPYVEREPVIAAIREQIAHLLLLQTEIKSEAYFEMETNIDDTQEFDPNLTDPFSATTDRNAPKLNIISKKQSDIIAEIEIEANTSDLNTQLMTDKTQTAPKLMLTRLKSEVDRNVPELNLSMKPSETSTNIPHTVPVTDESQTSKFILTKSTGLAPGVDRNVPKLNVIRKKQSDMVADIEANIPNLNTDPVTVRPQTPKLILTKSSGLAGGLRIILDESTSGGPAKRVYIVKKNKRKLGES